MEIKYTIQHTFVYLTIGLYLLAFIISITKQETLGKFTYLLGFISAAAAFAYRWYDTGHVPFQSMFEVCLSMGILIFPLSLFCKRYLNAGGYTVDMLMGAVILFPVGFVFGSEVQKLPPALQCWLFIPHVAVYLLSYVVMAKATVQACACILSSEQSIRKEHESKAYRIICLGFPLLTLGLLLGSWWGKLAWGSYWGWDPKELWSLASWLVFAGYYHFRYMFKKKYPTANSLWIVAGMIAILINLLWVNLSRIFNSVHNYT